MLIVELLGKSQREYVDRRTNEPRIAHNLNILTAEGEAGSLFVTAEVWKSVPNERGTLLVVTPRMRVYQGRAELGVAEVKVHSNGQAKG